LPPEFRFTPRSIHGKGVRPAKREFRSGCNCDAHGIGCQYKTCTCLQELEDDDGESEEEDDSQQLPPERYADDGVDEDFQAQTQLGSRGGTQRRGRGRRPKHQPSASASASSAAQRKKQHKASSQHHRKVYAYHSHGKKAGHLQSSLLETRKPIYECHEGCACDASTCPNRIVARGRKVPLQIFRTADQRGWGVRSTVEIRTGQFVDTYNGELITPAEAQRRRDQSTIAQRKDVYLFALDKFIDADSIDERLRGAPVEVDGEFLAGPTRFINHSCDPNLRIFARVGDHADKHIHDLAFFAIRDIPKGVELTFDYTDGVDEGVDDAADPAKKKDMTVCLCGSDKCRGFLW
jgi:[histone H3]-lysine9 N-trimethyltransferase SUV39H